MCSDMVTHIYITFTKFHKGYGHMHCMQSESVKSSYLYSDRSDQVELIQNKVDNGDRRKQEPTGGQEKTDGFKLSRLT